MTETLTIHEALCDIKVADSKINKAIQELEVVTSIKASSDKIHGTPIKDFTDRAVAQYQKVTDLINRTEALKAAVNESNSKTMIKINGKEVTIAVAIYMMKNGLDAKSKLLSTLKSQYLLTTRELGIRNGAELDARIDKYVESTFGQGAKDKGVNAKEVEEAMESFRKTQSYVLIDPIKVMDKIDALQEEIDNFKSHVDSAIQMSNATTQITIEY